MADEPSLISPSNLETQDIIESEENKNEIAEEYAGILDTEMKNLLEKMLESGVHYGRKKTVTHPKMKPFMLKTKKDIEVFNLLRTKEGLERMVDFMQKLLQEKKTILFVGTRPGSKEPIKILAQELSQPYVTERWLGGILTNFKTIKERLNYFKELKGKKETGEFAKYPIKDRQEFEKDLIRLEKEMGGIIGLERLPHALFVVDLPTHKTAVREARKLGIPIMAVCGSDNNPEEADICIPANDKASASVALLLDYLRGKLAVAK